MSHFQKASELIDMSLLQLELQRIELAWLRDSQLTESELLAKLGAEISR